MRDYPAMTDHTATVEPVPRRIRGFVGSTRVFDTVAARYVWDTPKYPAYHIPVADVDLSLLADDDRSRRLRRGPARTHSLRVADETRSGVAQVYGADADEGVADTVRFSWEALDAWFEEDEQVYVHPRNPFTRVDALRSSRSVSVALNGVTLAESSAPVLVFETGLTTRYYFDRTDVAFDHLTRTDTVTECPYKGRTSDYWTAAVGDVTVPDLAWSYAFPTRALSPVTNLVAFYDEQTDVTVDGVLQERPEAVR